MTTFAVIALGCKVNQYDAAAISAELLQLGLARVRLDQRPDVCVVQTCGVTAAAERKSRQALRQARRTAGRAILAGCLAESLSTGQPGMLVLANRDLPALRTMLCIWLQEFSRSSRRDALLGECIGTTQAAGLGHSKDEVWISPSVTQPPKAEPAIPKARVTRFDRGQRPATSPEFNIQPTPTAVKQNFPHDVGNSQMPSENRFSAHRPTWLPGHARAFVKIQDGCDANCTFCVVPSFRSVVSSRPAREVLAEVAALADLGFREVVLCGIFLGAYGQETAIRKRWHITKQAPYTLPRPVPPLVDLIGRIADTPGLARVRLSSIEPGDLTDELLNLLSNQPRVAPHLHLPLQSGSDRILARMNRQYDAGEFISAASRLRAMLDRPAITADVIVGFPDETDADFDATLAVLAEAGVCHVHRFAFSPRAGTQAHRWRREFVQEQVVRQRMARLTELAARLSLDFRRQFVGQTQQVVIEYESGSRPAGRAGLPRRGTDAQAGLRRGRTERYFMVRFPLAPEHSQARHDGDDPFARRVARVRIDRVEPGGTFGTLISVDD